MTNFNLFKCGNLVTQPKESIYLYIDQRLRPNMADYLTKYNLQKDQPQLWLEFQRRILNPSWMVPHPKFWIDDVVKESAQRVKKQLIGMKLPDFTTLHGENVEPKPISIKQIAITQKPDPNMCKYHMLPGT